MASSGNFAAINFLGQSTLSTVTPAGGNLFFDGSTLNPGNYEAGIVCNFGMKSGKWYWETYLSGGGSPVSGRDWNVGFAPYSTVSKSVDEGSYGNFLGNGSSSTLSGYGYTQYPAGTMGIRHNNSTSAFGSAHSSGDVLGHALDLDSGTYIIYKNGSSLGTAATGIDTSLTYFAAGGANGGNIGSFDVTFNFGQDSTFGGALSAGGNSDGNGFGDFKYSVPSGYLACSTANLSISDDIDPAQTDDDFPGKQFEAIAYTGSGGNNAITGLGFQPDLVWMKRRAANASVSNALVDSSRGRANILWSSRTVAESTNSSSTQDLKSFDSDGFTLGVNENADVNGSSDTYVAWAWRANGGTTASNSNGSITATVQANTAAGFSIATYTSPGSGTNHTVGHGLSGVDFIITKDRDSTFNWYCFHKSVPDKTFRLNSTTANFSYSNWSMGSSTWGSEDGYTHNSTDKFVAYCWQNVEGFQKFGTYVGNGNTDGPFIYTGFRPRFIITKSSTTTSGWNLRDSARSTSNPVNRVSQADTTSAELTSNYDTDFLSNGFKIRASGADSNSNGDTYFYAAWGDVPFKYNNTF